MMKFHMMITGELNLKDGCKMMTRHKIINDLRSKCDALPKMSSVVIWIIVLIIYLTL